MTQGIKILVVTYYNYPCKEQLLENVFAKELGKKHDVSIIFRGIRNKKKYTWHNSNIILIKKLKETNFMNRIINKLLIINSPLYIFYYIYKNKFKIIVFRDLPGQAIIFNLFKKLFQLKIFYQLTAPLGDINIAYSRNKIAPILERYLYLVRGYFFNILNKAAIYKSEIIFPISIYHKIELKI